jgi:hypothetical protein
MIKKLFQNQRREMGKLDDIFSGTKRFGVLSKLAKTLLVLPNSNADSERAFSIIKTENCLALLQTKTLISFEPSPAAYGFVTLHALSGHSLHRIQ